MGGWSRSVQAFAALPEARALVHDPRPAWIWARDGSAVLWAYLPGGQKLGARSMAELVARPYGEWHPLRRAVTNAAVLAPPGGTLARIRLTDTPSSVPLTCRVRPIATDMGEEGILVVAETGGDPCKADAATRCAFFAGLDLPVQEAGEGSGTHRGPVPGEPANTAIPPDDPVRPAMPQWLRARLAGCSSSPSRPQPEGGPAPSAGWERLSPQERAAFEEIAAALGSGAGGRSPAATGGLARSHACEELAPEDQDVGCEAAADDAKCGGQPAPAGDGLIPSAFFVPVRPIAAAAPAFSERPELRLREAQARARELASVLDVATDGVVILDHEGRIETLNGSAEALFCVRQREVAGSPFADLLAPDSRSVATDYFERLNSDGIAALINEGRELEGRSATGTIPLFVTFGRIGGEEAGRFCAVIRDLTQWKQAEANLVAARRKAEQASSHKSDFLARVSHEIRTPLNGIIGFADVIMDERFGPMENERYREYVRDIRTSGAHVLSLVNDLLDIAKIEAGKLELDLATVQLNELARECMALLQATAARAKIILRSGLAGDLPAVRADARTMRQIILNLLSNSIKFTPAGGQVIISTGQGPDGAVVLRVRDTGEGMTDSDLVRALEPFRQLATMSGDRNGTGLGLPLTKALVEANRANFAITSAKGEGTIVKVTFPSTCVVGPS